MGFARRNTVLTMRARSCFYPLRARVGVGGWDGECTHSVHLCCILRKSRTCQAIRISFSIRYRFPSLSPLSLFQPPHFPLILQRFLNTPSFFLFPPPSRIYSCLFLLLFFFLNSALYTLYSYFILSVLGNEPALRSSAVRYNRVNAS